MHFDDDLWHAGGRGIGKCRCEGQDEGDGHPTDSRAETFYISQTKKDPAECRVKIYITARQKGEDDLCRKGVRRNVPDVQVSTGSRAKDMVLDCHI